MSKEEKLDQLREHTFDGIEEYDNPLPGWWKAIFWASFFFGIGYVVYYHLGSGESDLQEYNRELSVVMELKKKHDAKLASTVSESYLANQAKGSGWLVPGKKLFLEKCAMCHKPDGSGMVGPNLTDTQSIFKPDHLGIYNVIKKGGRAGKGMIAWGSQISPKELEQVSLFVHSLLGKKVAGKAPEGNWHILPSGKIVQK